MAGTKRTISCVKQPRYKSCNSGKSPLSLGAYKNCVRIFPKKTEHIFVNCLLTVEFSLMAQSDSYVCQCVNNIDWNAECTIIYFYHSNVDKEEVNSNET